MPLLAELLTGPGQHLAERLAAPDPEQLDLGLAARPRQPPDPLRELTHGQHHRVVWTAERHALARQQRRLRDQARCVLHRDPVAHHPRIGDGQGDACTRLLEKDLGCRAGRAEHVHQPDGGPPPACLPRRKGGQLLHEALRPAVEALRERRLVG